ncbi:MAG: efflux RND transporter permease subunit [Candidatus Methylacidiphilales bacterium]|nr:multidrug efflux RND transporter permease subunit [Candidatus Methylacidiphilales bacterium]
MNISHFFIDRPIFAAVLSIVITIVGGLAVFTLPVAQYPEIAPPTIQVSATYTGATAPIVAETVATPIEQQVNGVENMLYMASSSTADGNMALTVTFKTGTDLDIAQVLVQNRVALATPTLPQDVRNIGITTKKKSSSLTLAIQIISPDNSKDQVYLSNYALLQLKDSLSRLPGVGDLTFLGARDYSMRVWLDPEKLAARGLSAADAVNAIKEQNVQVAAGTIGGPPVPAGQQFQYSLSTLGRLITPEQFGDIIVKTASDGRITYLKDIGRTELGAKDYSVNCYLDGKPCVTMAIFQLPGSNALATATAVRKEMAKLSKNFPPGVEYKIAYDTTVFVSESITAVEHTLLEAVVLVTIVVLAFLQSWRATVIPLVAVPVSIVGTFAVMSMLGFSLNNLSLFGLVLAIGIVVDDAIVVVENVEHHMAHGLSPRDAAFKAMDEVSGPVVAVALVLCAVFVPTAFITGISGEFYRQFALTIAVSTVISAFNSLTLSPALAAIVLRPPNAEKDMGTKFINFILGWFFKLFNLGFDVSTKFYVGIVRMLIRGAIIALVVYGGLIYATYHAFMIVPTGFIPPQDKGYLIVNAQLPDAASIERSDAVVRKLSELARSVPGVEHTLDLSGYSFITSANQSNNGSLIVILSPFEERKKDKELSARAIVEKMKKKFSNILEAQIAVVGPPPVDGLGSAGGFKMMVQDRNNLGFDVLQGGTDSLMQAARSQPPIAMVYSTFSAKVPQLFINIDRVAAKSLAVPLSSVFSTLQIYLGSLYVNDFTFQGRSYQVNAQAEATFRRTPQDVGNLKVANSKGEMVPLGAVLNIEEKTAPSRVQRYNMYPAADVNGANKPEFSSGQAMATMEDLAKSLPNGMDFEWTEMALQEKLAGNTSLYVFPLCVLFVFLVLSAQYESWSLPLIVILIVPMCLLCAIVGVHLVGSSNNIFTQIGLVVLVGLACKNAILIVEFAKAEQDKGVSRVEAAVEACRLRLRPILMTSFAFILGVVPLVRATGAGAEMRKMLGVAVFSGMLGVTFFGILLTPVFYVVIRALTDKKEKSSGAPGDGKGKDSNTPPSPKPVPHDAKPAAAH